MKLPTNIPEELHVDLESDQVIKVDAKTDATIQRAMIIVHRHCLQLSRMREVTMQEAAKSWVDSGFAEIYRQHYRRV